MIKISIVTVINNGVSFLDKYFDTIAKTEFSDLEVILIDSDLFPDTHSKIALFQNQYKKRFNITLIQSKERIGFSIGNNIGVEHAKGKFIMLLNPDTKLDKKCLNFLYKKTLSIKK